MLRNFTLDDASPLIQYDLSWADGFNTTDDSAMPLYQGRSFQCTRLDGATANITFYGTAIYLYGAKRINHGSYRITVDDEASVLMSGRPTPDGAEQFQTLLFSRQGLASGTHTLRLKNVPEDSTRAYVDIDYITITREVDGPTEATSVVATHDDFTYSSLWSRQINMEYYHNSTAHMTNTPGETATLKFHGPVISLYGGVGPTFGKFRVQVDNQDPVELSATRAFSHPPLVLFTTSGLGDGDHTLSITNLEGGRGLTIDYAEYIRTGSPDSESSNAGLIGGVVGGVVAGLAVLAALGCYFIRRRKHARLHSLDDRLPPTSKNTPWGSQIQITPYVDESSQSPLGYSNASPTTPSTYTPLHIPSVTTRGKAGMANARSSNLRYDQSAGGPGSQSGLSSLSSPTEVLPIHEIDAGPLPPMYDQVFSTPPPLPSAPRVARTQKQM